MIISIRRPMPGTGENRAQIEFIEPLRLAGKVSVNRAYIFNLMAYQDGKECSYGPGFEYNFYFENDEDATAFLLKFNGVVNNNND